MNPPTPWPAPPLYKAPSLGPPFPNKCYYCPKKADKYAGHGANPDISICNACDARAKVLALTKKF